MASSLLESKIKGLFGSSFLKLFLKTIFENKENTILVFPDKLFLFFEFCAFNFF